MTEPVVRTTLLEQRLPDGAEASHVEIRRIEMQPSVAGGPHRHNGAVFGSIERGSAVLQIGDGPEVVLRVGDVFYEPADTTISRFDATDEGVVFLGTFLVRAGQVPTLEPVT